jgi:hypothetical protein
MRQYRLRKYAFIYFAPFKVLFRRKVSLCPQIVFARHFAPLFQVLNKLFMRLSAL